MAMKKKQEIEFRYYEVPEGEQVLALLGESWRRVYGDDIKGFSLHFHNLLEIGFCIEGGGDVVLDEDVIAYSSGTLTVIPMNCPHVTNSRKNSVNYWEYLFLDPEAILNAAYPKDGIFVKRLLEQINRQAVCFEAGQNEELAGLVHAVMEECRNRKSYSVEVLRGLLLALVIMIARRDYAPEPEKHFTKHALGQITAALDHIRAYYMEEIRVALLARKCSLSETHFRRIFGEYMNMTPAEYLMLVRIQNACELIKKSHYSMEEVAQRVGYPTVSTFNRNFRRIVGTSPYQYKKNHDSYEGKLLNFKVSAKKGW